MDDVLEDEPAGALGGALRRDGDGEACLVLLISILRSRFLSAFCTLQLS